ncbi:hypothetical protein BCV69DRAFT_283553 [Microstroma glucosiphilum]|uniref:Ecp2 effector protein domain-containing protein n=1 Tax=Pseudomicrostroma glucosiphilum TaxID=1684307 RepID=A0A316U4C6_9BASI|nr:hypothetical protein BCV69DRAFT_283553 [Pseudomicrostroma glucosiphilum]PWN20030.1 hypothetical protein BCV69DRAFT_283553 [Pseudomicrostroma glucosiphilum]
MLFNSASLLCAIAVGAIAVSATPVKINRKPVDATEYFTGDQTVKKAEYIYYGHGLDGVSREDDEFCVEWTQASQALEQSGGVNLMSQGCQVVDYDQQVAAVWSTEAQNRGHTFDRTGPVGYSIQGTTWVTPKKDRYIGHGNGTCEKVVKGWCRDNNVSRTGSDLTVSA